MEGPQRAGLLLPPSLCTCCIPCPGLLHNPVIISDPLLLTLGLGPFQEAFPHPSCWVGCAFLVHLPHFIRVLKVPVLLEKRCSVFATPWTAARQASLSFTVSWSLLRLTFSESMMPSNHFLPWLLYLFLAAPRSTRILAPPSGTEAAPPALGCGVNLWTHQGSPQMVSFNHGFVTSRLGHRGPFSSRITGAQGRGRCSDGMGCPSRDLPLSRPPAPPCPRTWRPADPGLPLSR